MPDVVHALGGLVDRFPRFWRWLGRVESGRLHDQLRAVSIRRPIFICGLARAGSTLLHQIVGAHPGVATHRAKDYPMVFTPYWWRRATGRARAIPPRERPHRDGVMVTPDSPEALEEMVWMAFFPRCHDPDTDARLCRNDSHPGFEAFYDRHLRKLLLAERATRYAAKDNYHAARLPYLLKLYPDARFLLPVREPAAHVASLRHQHQWFSTGQLSHPRSLAYMQRTGHFEFGLDRRPINLGDTAAVRRVAAAWAAGDEARGLAMQWAMVYDHLADLIESDDRVRVAALPVRYEDVCADPGTTLHRVLEHCDLGEIDSAVRQRVPKVRSATTTPLDMSSAELARIREVTASAAARWGY